MLIIENKTFRPLSSRVFLLYFLRRHEMDIKMKDEALVKTSILYLILSSYLLACNYY
jgi:hypothetical protein